MIPDALYDLAFRFKRTKLWKRLDDTQLFAVRHGDGGIGYCCVMGMMGEHLALAVYPGGEGLESYRSMSMDRSRMDAFEVREIALSQCCVMVSFENKDELSPREVQEVRAYCAARGLELRGRKAYPQFERFRPLHMPWFVNEEADQAHLADALEAALEVADRLILTNPETIGFTEGKPFDRQIPLLEKKGGAFVWGAVALPAPKPVCYPSPESRDDILVAKLAKSMKTGGEWACDLFIHVDASTDEFCEGEPVAEPKNAPYIPFVLLIVDNNTGLVLNAELSERPKDYAEYFAPKVLAFALKNGRPARILVSNERARAFFAKLAPRMGAKLVTMAEIPFLEEAKEGFLQHFVEEDDGPEDETEQVMDMLRNPKTLLELPDEMMAQLVHAAALGALPGDVARNVEKEWARRGQKGGSRLSPLAPRASTRPAPPPAQAAGGGRRPRGRTSGSTPRKKEAHSPAKSYVISVSLQPGCFRHIRISGAETLKALHLAIIEAFGFYDDHAHAFFMDNRAWSDADAYFADLIEDEDRYTSDFTLAQAGLRVGKQFKYVFDFGEDWRFQCKVLRELDEGTDRPEVVRSAGDAPEQYAAWDEDGDPEGDEE